MPGLLCIPPNSLVVCPRGHDKFLAYPEKDALNSCEISSGQLEPRVAT